MQARRATRQPKAPGRNQPRGPLPWLVEGPPAQRPAAASLSPAALAWVAHQLTWGRAPANPPGHRSLGLGALPHPPRARSSGRRRAPLVTSAGARAPRAPPPSFRPTGSWLGRAGPRPRRGLDGSRHETPCRVVSVCNLLKRRPRRASWHASAWRDQARWPARRLPRARCVRVGDGAGCPGARCYAPIGCVPGATQTGHRPGRPHASRARPRQLGPHVWATAPPSPR
jgi:hypothetical protein